MVVAGANASPGIAAPPHSPVGINGQLEVCQATKLCNSDGRPIQLRGISSHGLHWYSECINRRSLKALAGDWGADVVRLSMYVQEGGYETDPRGYRKLVNRLIDKATRRGLYVIVDWHILSPGDPHQNLALAKGFFRKIAKRNRDKVNVLYEVANEPNGVTWAQLKAYHETIIPVIRRKDQDAVILLGTRGWSSLGVSEGADESEIVDDPVDADNVMYTFHFYAASHGKANRMALKRASGRLPMFVSEFGLQSYTGHGDNDYAQSRRYVTLMRRKKISWVYWNFADDWRSGSVLKEGACAQGAVSGKKNLKPSGVWIRKKMRSRDAFRTN